MAGSVRTLKGGHALVPPPRTGQRAVAGSGLTTRWAGSNKRRLVAHPRLEGDLGCHRKGHHRWALLPTGCRARRSARRYQGVDRAVPERNKKSVSGCLRCPLMQPTSWLRSNSTTRSYSIDASATLAKAGSVTGSLSSRPRCCWQHGATTDGQRPAASCSSPPPKL